MRLLKTHPHTSEWRGNEADTVRQKRKKKKGRPSPKGQESIVNESHRHATRNRAEGEEDYWKSASGQQKREEK